MDNNKKNKIIENLYLKIIYLEKELSKATENVSTSDAVGRITSMLDEEYKNEIENNKD